MKRGFASVLWGAVLKERPDICEDLKDRFGFELQDDNNMANIMPKIIKNIRSYSRQGHSDQSTVYVFGKENQKYVESLGLKSVLLQNNPYKYHPTKQIYKHKLEAYKYILEDFDEVVLLDFDILLRPSLPDNFWNVLGQREAFQAPLHGYRNHRISHRKGKLNKWIPAGAFVYMRDKSIPDRLWKLNESGPNSWSCEPCFALLTDEMTDGWKDIQTYWEKFEPQFYTSSRSPYRYDKKKYAKNVCFYHGNMTKAA